MEIKQQLRQLRGEKQATQKQVAAAIGISEQHYQFYESGKHLPSLENLCRLADYFAVTTDYLLGRSDQR